MNPTVHRPAIRDARPPASLRTFDGNATSAITSQWERMKETSNVGDHLPDHEDMPLYGHRFNLTDPANNTVMAVNFNIEANNQDDIRYVEARDRLATARARERSRGSRMFNWAFRRDRGRGEDHFYHIDRYEAAYREEFTDFIARKMQADGRFEDNFDLAVQASSRAVVQEQIQMGALERKAAEAKSGNRILNTLRNNKRLRIGVGVALSGLGVVGLATGIAPLAAAAFTARTALSAEGGYLLGRTGWDAVQGARARRLPRDDIRMASHRNGDISGRLNARRASERLIKILGAEARAGSTNPDRQQFIHTVGTSLVHQHYAQELEADLLANQVAAPDTRTAVRGALQAVYDSFTNPLQQERLASDQTQSRRRHVAGIVGGVVIGAIPGLRALGSMHIGLPFGGGNGGRTHALANSIPKTNNHIAHTIDGFKAPQATTPGAGGNVPGAGTTTPGVGGGTGGGSTAPGNLAPGTNGNTVPGTNGSVAPGTPGSTVPNPGATVIPGNMNGLPNGSIIIDGNGNEVIIGGGTINETAAHTAGITATEHTSAAHGAAVHRLHETFRGISTSELHVKAGGGFISTFQEQYNLSPAQADAAYQAMHAHLLHAPGTYMQGTDIRISAPGIEKLPVGAQTDLENYLKGLHRMSDHASSGSAAEHATTTTTPGVTEQAPGASVGTDSTTGGSIPPGTPSNLQTGGALPPTPPDPNITGGAAYSSGLGSNLYIPGAPVDPAHLQALNNVFNVPETSINVLTTDQAKLAKDYLSQLVVVGNGGIDLPPSDKSLAQAVIQKYIENSLDRPVTTPDAQQAIANLKQLWDQMGHNIISINKSQADSLQQALEAVNNG